MVNPQKYRAQKMSYQCLSWCYRNKAFLSDSVIQSHQHVWMFCGFLKCYTYLVIDSECLLMRKFTQYLK